MGAMNSVLPLWLLSALALSAVSGPARALRLSEAFEPVAATALAGDPRQRIAGYLRGALGEPYRRGAAGSEGYDCSGLVLSAYAAAGREVPRHSGAQLRQGVPVDPAALRPGDLLFYRFSERQPERLHVAVYVGEGRAIHASVKHREVREIDIRGGLWTRRLVAAVSLL